MKRITPQNSSHNEKASSSRGYAILFTVLLVAIILSVSLGIANIALKELNFSEQTQGSNTSFFAADSAGECALYAVNKDQLAQNLVQNPNTPLSCGTETMGPTSQTLDQNNNTVFHYDGFTYGTANSNCANVSVTVATSPSPSVTIVSDGYNVACTDINGPSSVNRELSYTIPL